MYLSITIKQFKLVNFHIPLFVCYYIIILTGILTNKNSHSSITNTTNQALIVSIIIHSNIYIVNIIIATYNYKTSI